MRKHTYLVYAAASKNTKGARKVESSDMRRHGTYETHHQLYLASDEAALMHACLLLKKRRIVLILKEDRDAGCYKTVLDGRDV